MRPPKCLLATACLIVSHLSNQAATVSIRPAADTALFQNRPNNNLGAQAFMPVGVTFNPVTFTRGLMRFDLSSIPTNATVTAVTLRISSVRGGGGSQTYDLHRMLQPWIEGTKFGGPNGVGDVGALATAGEPTWNNRAHPSTAWAIAGSGSGSDYNAVASASVVLTGIGGSATFASTAALVADVQEWLTNAPSNRGWLLKDRNETAPGTARRIASREDAPNAPLLTVTFSAPVPFITNSSPLPFGDVGVPYSQTFGATGGVPPYVWVAVGGVPAGLTMSPSGTLSGMPITAASPAFGVRVTDSVNVNTTKTFSITIDARPRITSSILTNGDFVLSFPAISNRQYAVEHRTIVHTGEWSTLTNFTVPTSGTVRVQDPLAPSQRFYRLRKN